MSLTESLRAIAWAGTVMPIGPSEAAPEPPGITNRCPRLPTRCAGQHPSFPDRRCGTFANFVGWGLQRGLPARCIVRVPVSTKRAAAQEEAKARRKARAQVPAAQRTPGRPLSDLTTGERTHFQALIRWLLDGRSRLHLARALGVDDRILRRALSECAHPRPELVAKIAAFAGLAPGEALNGTGLIELVRNAKRGRKRA